MIQRDFYTGEPTLPIENTAANDAAFGAQYYAPSYNQQYMGYQPHSQYNPYQQQPYGYNTQYYGYQPQSMYNGYNQPYPNYNPYNQYQQSQYYNQYQQQQPYYGYNGYQQPQYNSYQQQYPNYNPYNQYQQQPYGYNTQYYGYQQPQYNQQPMFGYVNGQAVPYNQPQNAIGYDYEVNQRPQEIVYEVKNSNPISNNEFMPNKNYKEEIRKLTIDYTMKEIKEDIDRINNQDNRRYGESMFGFGNNYYNMPYYGYNSHIRSEVAQKINEMKEEARENNLNFVVNMMKTAYKVKGIDVSEEELRERYSNKTVTIKDPNIINAYYPKMDPLYERLNRMVPVEDRDEEYRNLLAYNAKEQVDRCIPQDCDLNEFLDNIGKLRYEYWKEKQMKKERAQRAAIYDQAAYGSFMKKCMYDKYIKYKNPDPNEQKFIMNQGNGNYRGIPVPKEVNSPNLETKFEKMSQEDIINYSEDQNNNEPFSVLKQCASISEDGTLNITFNNFGREDAEKYASEEAKFREDRERFLSFMDRVAPSYVNEAKDKGSKEIARSSIISNK